MALRRGYGNVYKVRYYSTPSKDQVIRSKSSRFQKSHNEEVSQKENLKDLELDHLQFVKPPAVIRKEIREQYGKNVPEAFIKDIIEESKRTERDLRESVQKDGTIYLGKYEKESVESFLQYVEGVVVNFENSVEADIEETKEDDESFLSRLSGIFSSSTKPELSMEKITDEVVDHLNTTPREDLLKLLRALDQNLKKSNKDVPLELQSRLFNCAIRIPAGAEQEELLFIAGNLIYLNEGLRADPFNEARYINTLTKYGKYNRLEYLWNSRRSKDVKNQRFWDEIAIFIYIAASNLYKLEVLAKGILSTYGYLSPNCVVELIKLNLLKNPKRELTDWVQILDKIGEEHGFEQSFKERELAVDITSLDDGGGFLELNKIESISFEDIYFVIAAFLNAERYDQAIALTMKYTNKIPEIQNYLLYKFSELPELIQAGLYYASSNSTYTSLTKKLGQVLQVSTKSEQELKQMMFKRLLQKKTPLLNPEDFDRNLTSEDCFSIIKDLTKRGMHEEVNQLLGYMQAVKLEQDKGSELSYLLPPVSSLHYIPILQKIGRHKSDEVLERVEQLLKIMESVGVQRGEYFHTQLLLTIYRKKEFVMCVDYIKENFIEADNYCKSRVLLDTIWTIYRDSNRSFDKTGGVRINYDDIYRLIRYTFQCYEISSPSLTNASLVLETLIATQNFPLALVYIQKMKKFNIMLDRGGFLIIMNSFSELSKYANMSEKQSANVFDTIKLTKQQLLKHDKFQKQFKLYELDSIYYLCYNCYKIDWRQGDEKLQDKISTLAMDLEVEYVSSDDLLQNGEVSILKID